MAGNSAESVRRFSMRALLLPSFLIVLSGSAVALSSVNVRRHRAAEAAAKLLSDSYTLMNGGKGRKSVRFLGESALICLITVSLGRVVRFVDPERAACSPSVARSNSPADNASRASGAYRIITRSLSLNSVKTP